MSDGSNGLETAMNELPPARLDRRAFLARAALLGAGGVAFAACGSSPGSAGTTTGKPLDRKAVLNFAMSTTIPGLDPQKWWNGAAGCGQMAVFESLLTIDPYTEKLVPTLATAMPTVANNGLRYTFKLRKGVKFTNGQPLTSADVKYSFERLVIPSYEAQAGSLYTPLGISGMSEVLNEKAKTLSGVTTPDPETIVFDFDYPDSAFIYLISFPSAAVVPMALFEEVGFDHFNWNPVGTGPFTADVVNEQTQITLKAQQGLLEPRLAALRRRQLADGHRRHLVDDPHRIGSDRHDVRPGAQRLCRERARQLELCAQPSGGQDTAGQLLLDVAQLEGPVAEGPPRPSGDRHVPSTSHGSCR